MPKISDVGKELLRKEKERNKVDSITSAGKKLNSDKERMKRLKKSVRVKKKKAALAENLSEGAFLKKKNSTKSDTRREGELKNVTPAQRKKFKSLFFVK